MTATDHPGGFWRRKGYRSRVTCIYEQVSRQTRKKQQEKRKNKQIRRCLQSGQKPQREETNIKIAKKKQQKRNKQQNKQRYTRPLSQSLATSKQQAKTAENRVKRGYVVNKKPATTNVAKLEIHKWAKKNKKNKQTTQPKRESKNLYITP